MTVRTRRPERGIRTRLGRLVDTEERQQMVVTTLFIGAIIAVILILIGAIALTWYNDNLRPLGKVGSVEIGPQLLKDRIKLEQWRIARDENRITQAQIDGTLSADDAQTRLSELDQRSQNLATTGLDDLIDVMYQSQLASEEGVAVTDQDVDAKLASELAGVEKRHVLSLTVEPQVADETAGASVVERRAALAAAEQALADLTAGKDWAEVAKQYGTDDQSKNGGDLGVVSPLGISDSGFATELFKLDQGATTGIIRGDDGAYRIGRVTEVQPAGEDPGLRSGLLKDVSEQSARQLLGYEVGSDRLKDKITADALAQTPEQVKLGVIYIAGLTTDDPDAAAGEVDYSEIVYAPNDNLDVAPSLPAEDAAWGKVKTEADAALAELSAITDIEQRTTRFGEIATDNSDSPSAQDGGAVGFVTKSLPPQAVSDALFNGTHQKGDLIGPIRGDAAYYVLMFNERRASPEDRLKAVQDALAAPGADFNAVAKLLSEGPEKADGGEVGWLTKDQLSTDIVDKVWALAVGQVSEPLDLGEGKYFVKVEEKAVRALDADQTPTIRQNAFDNWYSPKRDDATTNGTIVTNDAGTDTTDGNLITGGDQGTP